MAKINQNKTSRKYYNDIEYRMTAGLAESLLKQRQGEELHMTEQEFLCRYVNEELGVKGNCVAVTTNL